MDMKLISTTCHKPGFAPLVCKSNPPKAVTCLGTFSQRVCSYTQDILFKLDSKHHKFFTLYCVYSYWFSVLKSQKVTINCLFSG